MLVIFGHQSVGADLLNGIRELATKGASTPRILPIEELGATAESDAIASFRVGQNGDPLAKIRHFAAVACAEPGALAQVALFKFCYADVNEKTDIGALSESYQEAVDRVRAANPTLVVAHVTVPIRTVPTSALDRLRRLMGQVDRRIAANAAREAFSQWLRGTFASSGALFDLAAIESRTGTAKPNVAVRCGGVPALAPEYSSDGGHLNAAGRHVVAQAFLDFLDRLASRAVPACRPERRASH